MSTRHKYIDTPLIHPSQPHVCSDLLSMNIKLSTALSEPFQGVHPLTARHADCDLFMKSMKSLRWMRLEVHCQVGTHKLMYRGVYWSSSRGLAPCMTIHASKLL